MTSQFHLMFFVQIKDNENRTKLLKKNFNVFKKTTDRNPLIISLMPYSTIQQLCSRQSNIKCPTLTDEFSGSLSASCCRPAETVRTPTPRATISFLSVQGFPFLTGAADLSSVFGNNVVWGSSLWAAISWPCDRAEPEDREPEPASTQSTSEPANETVRAQFLKPRFLLEGTYKLLSVCEYRYGIK